MKSLWMLWVSILYSLITPSFFKLSTVVESRLRRKKSKGGTGVFQFAKTVEESVWEDEEQQKAIQVRLVQAKKNNRRYRHLVLTDFLFLNSINCLCWRNNPLQLRVSPVV